MKACKAEEFFKFTKEEVLYGVGDTYNVVFEDGVLTLSPHEIIVNRIIWDILYAINKSNFVKKKGMMSMKQDYSITKYYKNGFFASSSLSGVIEKILEDICIFYVEPEFDRRILDDIVFGKIEEVYNDIYNYLVCGGFEYFTSIDVLDFYEIQFQDRVIDAIKKIGEDRTQESITQSYKVLDDVIATTPELKDNTVVTGYLSGAFNKRQVYQILSSRGFLSELNSDIIPTPVLSSFFLGLSSAFEVAAESRSSAKAQRSQEIAIEQSEYTARTIQLSSMRYENLVDGDCGSNEYIEYYISPDPIIGKPELPLLEGKWYLDEETNTEKCISKNDTHLIGKTVKLRSQAKCKHREADSCCLKCFGRIGYSIPYLSNIGHVVASIITQIITQSLLSVKHQSDSASGLDFHLGPIEREFFVKSNNNGLKFDTTRIMKGKTYELIVKQKDFNGLAGGLYAGMDFSRITPNRNSRLDKFYIKITDNKTNVFTYHECSIAFTKSIKKETNRGKPRENTSNASTVYGSFTSQFIKYIVGDGENKNYYLDDSGENYCINLNNWKSKNDIIVFPNLEFNFLDLQKDFKRNLRDIGSTEGHWEKLLQNLFDLLNSKLDIPYSIIEALVCAFIVRDPETKDVRLSRGLTDYIVRLSDIIFNSSLGVMAAFEHHNKHFMSPKTFNGFNKGSHVLDVALKPQESVARYKRLHKNILFQDDVTKIPNF